MIRLKLFLLPGLELSIPRGKYNMGISGGCFKLFPGRPKNGCMRKSGVVPGNRFKVSPSGRNAAIIDAGIQSPSLLGTVTRPSGVKPMTSELRSPVANTSADFPSDEIRITPSRPLAV